MGLIEPELGSSRCFNLSFFNIHPKTCFEICNLPSQLHLLRKVKVWTVCGGLRDKSDMLYVLVFIQDVHRAHGSLGSHVRCVV